MPNRVYIKFEKNEIEVPADYVFVIGKDNPVIDLGDGNE